MAIDKLISRWTGFSGAPGFTVMYFQDTQTTAPADMRAFWDGVKSALPTNVTITVDGSGDTIDEATGDLVSVWTGTAPAPVVGTGAGVYAAPAGAMVRWNTAGIVAGRRVRGKTFLVPAISAAYAGDGSLDAADITVIQTAADALIAAAGSTPVVWARPFAGGVGVPARVGSFHNITTATIPDKAVVLTSRRD